VRERESIRKKMYKKGIQSGVEGKTGEIKKS
jgi:hypothetical protein